MLEQDPFIKLIHYVRDPRGILESRFRHSKVKAISQFKSGARQLCSKIVSDLEVYNRLATLFPKNFMLVKYEDLVDNSTKSLSIIHQFLGIQVPDSVEKFMQSALNSKRNGNAMQTNRKNGTATALQWENHVDKDILHIMEDICHNAIKTLDYPFVTLPDKRPID